MLLITQPRVGTSHNEILALQFAARDAGWDVLPAPNGWRLDDETIASGQTGVPYGSQLFCEVIAQQMGWKLVGNDHNWLARVPEVYSKRQVQFMTLGEAKRLQETRFIKPADDKVFPCKVYSPGELQVHESVPDDTPTLVSEVVHFDLEYRCFTDGKRVLTWSNYICYDHIADPKYWDMIPTSEELPPYEFVSNLVYDMQWHGGTVPSVIDVGRIPGKGWAVIESNQCWASGLYGCDPGRALKVMELACVKI